MRRDFDVVVLGGGINGCGVARDCAMRGLSVCLVERSDFGVGASGNSSGMIHGGIRYMLSDRHVTELACRDSGYIQRIAPHLLFRIPFLMPFEPGKGGARLRDKAAWYAAEVYVGTYDLFQPLKRGKPSVRLSADELYRLEPALRPGLAGAVTLDEWGIDAFRLCVSNALAARENGAEVLNWTEARELKVEDGRIAGVRLRDRLTGSESLANAPVVVNATGAWSPEFARRNRVKVPMRPGKGVHLTLDRRYSNYGVICSAVDGRQMFVMPHENETIVGTTDDDYYGDPDDLTATTDEVEYLFEGASALLPGVRHARLSRAFCGLRTTLYAYGPTEDALSREHGIVEHSAEGVTGLLSFVGGKLASYRAQAEEVTDRVFSLLRRPQVVCKTHEVPLPGGEATLDPSALARQFGVATPIAARLTYRHGNRALEVLRLLTTEPGLGLVVCREEGILAAEVVYCIRNELVHKLEDLRRRCRLAVGACGGLDCARLAAQIAARELGWSPERMRSELGDLLDAGWRERRPVLDGVQLAEEELLRGSLASAEIAW